MAFRADLCSLVSCILTGEKKVLMNSGDYYLWPGAPTQCSNVCNEGLASFPRRLSVGYGNMMNLLLSSVRLL